MPGVAASCCALRCFVLQAVKNKFAQHYVRHMHVWCSNHLAPIGGPQFCYLVTVHVHAQLVICAQH